MRKIFRQEPSERQVVNEISKLLEDFQLLTVGSAWKRASDKDEQRDLRVHFWDRGDGKYDDYEEKKPCLSLPNPAWTSRVSGPDYDWTNYWQLVAHEVAHHINYEWFRGVNHREMFYAVLIALCSWWDLPPKVMDSEISYHGGGYKAGKKMLASVAMDRIYRISTDQDCDNRPLFDRQGCEGKPCTNHPIKALEVTEGQLTFHL